MACLKLVSSVVVVVVVVAAVVSSYLADRTDICI